MQKGGGVLVAVGLLGGAAIGVLLGEATVGLIAGFALGVAGALLVTFLGSRRR